MVGHSKGGAEAIANAVATNKNAIVFNPAHPSLSKYDLSSDNYTAEIISYVVKHEFLDDLYGPSDKFYEVIYLPTQHWNTSNAPSKRGLKTPNGLKNHSIKSVIKALN